MAAITNLVAGAFIPEVWSKEITRSFGDNRVMARLVSRFDSDIKAYGDTVNIPNLSSLTATYKVNGTSTTDQAVTESSVALVVNKHAYARVTVEDLAKIQSKYDLLQEYTGKIGQAVAEIQDNDLMALYTSFATTIGASSSNTGLAWSYIVSAIRVLDSANVPGMNRSLTVDAYGFQALRNMDQFVRYDATGKSGKFEDGSTRGKIFGVDVFMTNNCPVTTSLVTGLLFHKEAIALAEQKSLRTQSDYQPRSLDTAVIADLLYGVKARRTDALVRVQYGQI